METLELRMPDETQGTASFPCPKCKSPDTVRTGAFAVVARRSDDKNASPEGTISYDRLCRGCGHHFPERSGPQP